MLVPGVRDVVPASLIDPRSTASLGLQFPDRKPDREGGYWLDSKAGFFGGSTPPKKYIPETAPPAG